MRPFGIFFKMSFLGLLILTFTSACKEGEGLASPNSFTNGEQPRNASSHKLKNRFIGKTVALKGSNNFFVSSEGGKRPAHCNRSVVKKTEEFIIVKAGEGEVALKSGGKFLSSGNGTEPMTCNSSEILAVNKFTLIKNPNNTVSFKGNNGKFVSSENDEKAMTCNRDSAQDWEQFRPILIDSLSSAPNWHKANLTHFTSYPAPGSDECINFNGCKWAGFFAFLDGQKTETWVKQHHIIAIHSKDAYVYKLKTFEIKKGNKTIQAKVYDECADSDCSGCCTTNANANGIGFLIDIEKYTKKQFGAGDGVVEWRCLDCK